MVSFDVCLVSGRAAVVSCVESERLQDVQAGVLELGSDDKTPLLQFFKLAGCERGFPADNPSALSHNFLPSWSVRTRSRAESFARGLGQCWQPGLQPPGSTNGIWRLYATALRGLSRFGSRMDVHGPFSLAALKPLDEAVPVLLTPACSQDDWQDTALA